MQMLMQRNISNWSTLARTPVPTQTVKQVSFLPSKWPRNETKKNTGKFFKWKWACFQTDGPKKTPPTEVFFHPEKSAFKATSRAVGSVVCPEVNNSVNMGMLPASAEAGHLKGSNGQSTFRPFKATYMGVSENGGIPKSSISIGFPL